MSAEKEKDSLEKFREMPTAGIKVGLALGKWDGKMRTLAQAVLNERKAKEGEKKINNLSSFPNFPKSPKGSVNRNKMLIVAICSFVIVITLLVWFAVLRGRIF